MNEHRLNVLFLRHRPQYQNRVLTKQSIKVAKKALNIRLRKLISILKIIYSDADSAAITPRSSSLYARFNLLKKRCRTSGGVLCSINGYRALDTNVSLS